MSSYLVSRYTGIGSQSRHQHRQVYQYPARFVLRPQQCPPRSSRCLAASGVHERETHDNFSSRDTRLSEETIDKEAESASVRALERGDDA